MNIPLPCWTVFIVVNGKMINIGDIENFVIPNEEQVKKMALEKNYTEYTDYTCVMNDDGREN